MLKVLLVFQVNNFFRNEFSDLIDIFLLGLPGAPGLPGPAGLPGANGLPGMKGLC